MLEKVMATEAVHSHDLMLIMDRHGYNEETYFSFSYSPIRDEAGKVGGIFTPVIEMTSKVIGERRLKSLRDLGAHRAFENAETALPAAVTVLVGNPHDVRFAATYRYKEDCARLIATAGLERGSLVAPNCVSLSETAGAETGWPIAFVLSTRR